MRTAFGRRTEAQQDHIIEQRLRAIETGEWMEKLGFAELTGAMPPIGANFRAGESMQDLQNRAARAGIHLPGPQRPSVKAMLESAAFERKTGVPAYAMPVKDRFGLSSALDGFSAWDVPDLVEYDFSMANIAAAATIPGLVLPIMPGTNAALIGSPDGLDPATTADTASRKAGTGSKKYLSVLSCWIYSRTSAGAVYVGAAGMTFQPFVVSAAPGSAAQLSTALSAAAQSIPALTTFWTQVTLVAPADRVIQKFSGTGAAAGIVAAYWGDALFATLVTTALQNIQGNTLAMTFELA